MQVKLDRATGNCMWFDQYGGSKVPFLAPSLSYHCPMLVSPISAFGVRKGSFKFLNVWPRLPVFLSFVQPVWHSPVNGCAMFRIATKLKALKPLLKKFHTDNMADISLKVQLARSELQDLQFSLAVAFNSHDYEREKMLR